MSGNGDSSGGFFNVATLVITWALTGDDSPSPLRGFTGSSGQLERERERESGYPPTVDKTGRE